MYKCGGCGTPVLVVPNEKPVKVCDCVDVVILADMSATAVGTGGVKVGKKK